MSAIVSHNREFPEVLPTLTTERSIKAARIIGRRNATVALTATYVSWGGFALTSFCDRAADVFNSTANEVQPGAARLLLAAALAHARCPGRMLQQRNVPLGVRHQAQNQSRFIAHRGNVIDGAIGIVREVTLR